MTKLHDRYTYSLTWPEEDQEHVALCAEFPSCNSADPTLQAVPDEIETSSKSRPSFSHLATAAIGQKPSFNQSKSEGFKLTYSGKLKDDCHSS